VIFNVWLRAAAFISVGQELSKFFPLAVELSANSLSTNACWRLGESVLAAR